MTRSEHWNTGYRTKSDRDVSWFEATPDVSLRLMEHAGLAGDTCVLDVGGGDSRVVDALIARGLTCLAVLDVSGAALERARRRLAEKGSIPTWIEADVVDDWTAAPVDIWHDRAAFHFLVEPGDRARYRAHLHQILKPGGTAIVATFALEGPTRCSGLPVVRYSPESLALELGPDLTLVEATHHTHTTPWGAAQLFQYSRFRRASTRAPGRKDEWR